MRKCLLLIFVLLTNAACLLAQQEDVLRMISSSHSRFERTRNLMINYRPVYEHKGSTLSADSGYLHEDSRVFEGFGRVIITQPNGTVIYADKLHYTESSQFAVLTNNVRMIDGHSVLTTNYLTYNMRSSVGTYTGGGRIVNGTDTITSKNAYYFDNTRDAYFRHDVVVRTPKTKIYTDTMRYNSGSKMVYFYGPTNIKGNNGENLYTESGNYNTQTESAEFGKNNLYTEDSKFLRGDSLYYDGISGNGRAVHHVVFIDTADVFFTTGGIGLYNKVDESITMTINPLVTTVTRERNKPQDSTSVRADSTGAILDTALTALPPDSTRRLEPDSDHVLQAHADDTKVDSIYLTADTLFSQLIPLHSYRPMNFELNRDGGEIEEAEEDFSEAEVEDFSDEGEDLDGLGIDTMTVDTETGMQSDSPTADTSQGEPPPEDPAEPERQRALVLAKEAAAHNAEKEKVIKEAVARRQQEVVPLSAGRELLERNLAADSVLRQEAPIPTGGEVDSLLGKAVTALISSPQPDSNTIDSATLATMPNAAIDSAATTRIIKAHRNVRMFKSDLQAVADSAYYGYPDSMMRFFGSPMVWAQGSQMSSDSIYLQIVNEQLDNLVLLNNAFIVNTQLDSTKYNQIKGRKITGFFTNNQLERMFIDGNAESLYYTADKDGIRYTDMYHSRSSRIKILVEDNEITDFVPIRNIEGKISPLHLIAQEAEILPGFIWKPGDRPKSKQDLLDRKREIQVAEINPDTDAAPAGAISPEIEGYTEVEPGDSGDIRKEEARNDSPTIEQTTDTPSQPDSPTTTAIPRPDSLTAEDNSPDSGNTKPINPDTSTAEPPLPDSPTTEPIADNDIKADIWENFLLSNSLQSECTGFTLKPKGLYAITEKWLFNPAPLKNRLASALR